MEFKNEQSQITCYDWDGFNGDVDVYIGSIIKNEDDEYYWFHPTINKIPLTCA